MQICITAKGWEGWKLQLSSLITRIRYHQHLHGSPDGASARASYTFLVMLHCYMTNRSGRTLCKLSILLLSGANHQSHFINNADKLAQNMLKLALDPGLQNSTIINNYISLTLGQYHAHTSHKI